MIAPVPAPDRDRETRLSEACEEIARELYRQWRATCDNPEQDLPDWEDLEADLFDEDEAEPKGWYRDRAAELLALPALRATGEGDRLRRDLAALVAAAPVVQYDNGYPIKAVPVSDLLGVLNLDRRALLDGGEGGR